MPPKIFIVTVYTVVQKGHGKHKSSEKHVLKAECMATAIEEVAEYLKPVETDPRYDIVCDRGSSR